MSPPVGWLMHKKRILNQLILLYYSKNTDKYQNKTLNHSNEQGSIKHSTKQSMLSSQAHVKENIFLRNIIP